MKVNVLCVGDIVGRPGRRALAQKLASLVQERQIDCVIANAENAAGGPGLTPQMSDKLMRYGVHLITLGGHAYRKKDIIPTLESSTNIAHPANLSPHAAGREYALYRTGKGITVAVVPLIGRIFMKPADCPYAKIDALSVTLYAGSLLFEGVDRMTFSIRWTIPLHQWKLSCRGSPPIPTCSASET